MSAEPAEGPTPARSAHSIEFLTGVVMSAIVAALAQRPPADPATAVVVVAHVAALPLVLWHLTTVVSGAVALAGVGALGYVALVAAYGYAAWTLQDTPFRWVGYFLEAVAAIVVVVGLWAMASGGAPDEDDGDLQAGPDDGSDRSRPGASP